LNAFPLPSAFRFTSWSQVAPSAHADTERSSPQRGCVSQSAPGDGEVVGGGVEVVAAAWGVLLADSGGGVVVVVVAWGVLLAGSEGAGVVTSSSGVVSVSPLAVVVVVVVAAAWGVLLADSGGGVVVVVVAAWGALLADSDGGVVVLVVVPWGALLAGPEGAGVVASSSSVVSVSVSPVSVEGAGVVP